MRAALPIRAAPAAIVADPPGAQELPVGGGQQRYFVRAMDKPGLGANQGVIAPEQGAAAQEQGCKDSGKPSGFFRSLIHPGKILPRRTRLKSAKNGIFLPMVKPSLTILLASPRGFCAGVERAIGIVEKALEKFGAPVYVRHEIVHNKQVLEDLRAKGAVFVKELNEVPEGAPVIFSAHGVPKRVPEEAQKRNMIYVDATCPLVSKVHREAELHFRNGHHILLIGHAGHPEVIGTMGQLPEGAATLVETVGDARAVAVKDPEKIAYVTQTTLSIDDTKEIIDILRARFPAIAAPKKEDICYATTNRQMAVKDIAPRSDVVIVIGSANSSNSNRLVEMAITCGAKKAFLADIAADIRWEELKNIRTLGLTAGASAPEKLVQDVIAKAREYFEVTIETVTTAEENVTFRLPGALAA